jgi:hypothetical protein
MGAIRMLGERGNGPPVHTYEPVPGVPSVSVLRFDGRELTLGRSANGARPLPRLPPARLLRTGRRLVAAG